MPGTGSSPVFVDSVEEAVEFLKGTQGHVLVTTGSKELSKYKALPDWEERIYARCCPCPRWCLTAEIWAFTGII